MEEVEELLIDFAELHGLMGDEGIAEDFDEIISQSDSIQLELEDFVCSIYKCLQH